MLSVSRSSEHAIRALTYLAVQGGERFHLGRELADLLGIPAPFLNKCLQPLVVRGILESRRGRNGGFRLRKEPAEITLFDVVDVFDELSRPRECFLGQADCTDERACPMHEFWKEAFGGFKERLLSTTVADLSVFCDRNPKSGYPCNG